MPAEIVDGLIDAYSPVTGRLMRLYRNWQRAHKFQHWDHGTMGAEVEKVISQGINDGQWFQFGELMDVWFPKHLIGPTGGGLRIYGTARVTTNDRAINANALFRLRIGANAGPTVLVQQDSSNATTETDITMELLNPAMVGDAYNAVVVEHFTTVEETSPIGTATIGWWHKPEGGRGDFYNPSADWAPAR